MEKSIDIGGNRTGMDVSPLLAKEMLSGMEEYTPSAGDGLEAFTVMGGQYVRADGNVGSMPRPGTMKGTLKTMTGKLKGRNPEVFLNKLGERLAYERSGVRLYEAFVRKCEALMADGAEALVSLEELLEIRDEERQHFLMLQECILTMGADPTAQTPDADVSGVASMGIMQVLTDPRTSVGQGLEALLSLELIDNAAWELMVRLADDMKLADMAEQFRKALAQEESHLQRVRSWYENGIRTNMSADMSLDMSRDTSRSR